jgi:hypothetical protein
MIRHWPFGPRRLPWISVEGLPAKVARGAPVASSHPLNNAENICVATTAMRHSFVVVPAPRRAFVFVIWIRAIDVPSRSACIPLDAERGEDFQLAAGDDSMDIVRLAM